MIIENETGLKAVENVSGYAALINDLNVEADGIKSDIERIGNEVIDSIPDDYTELANQVSQLSGAINEVDFRLSESIAEIDNNLQQLVHEAKKTFSLSDKDGTYYFLPFKMESGKEYHIKSSKTIGCYLRAEKYVTPSIQTVPSVYANTDVIFTAVSDLEWVVIAVALTTGETFTVELWDDNDKISVIEKNILNNAYKIGIVEQQVAVPESVQSTWKSGNLSTANDGQGVSVSNATTRITTNGRISTNGISKLGFLCPSGFKYRVRFFAESGALVYGTSYLTVESGIDDALVWHTDNRLITVPSNAGGFSVSISYDDDREISPDASADFFIGINGLYSKIQEFDNRITALENASENEYRGKKISILGDSISTFSGYIYPGNRARYPQSNLLTDVNDTYWMRLINEFGMVLGINESWAGSMVSNTQQTDDGDKGPNRCMASFTRINHLGENGTPDIILVNGGTNDIYATSSVGTFNTESPRDYTDEQIANLPVATFADAYRTMLIRLQKKYPTSKIICLLPNYTTAYYTPTKADEYCEVIKEACDFFGVKWKDMRASGITMFNRDTYLPDGIHYNVLGMSVIERNIKKFMQYDFTI